LIAVAESEYIFKNAAETGENVFKPGEPPKACVAEPLVAIAVVNIPFLTIAQDFIGLGRFLESFLRLLITLITIGMILHGHFSIALLDLLFGGVSLHFQDFVITTFYHVRFLVYSIVLIFTAVLGELF